MTLLSPMAFMIGCGPESLPPVRGVAHQSPKPDLAEMSRWHRFPVAFVAAALIGTVAGGLTGCGSSDGRSGQPESSSQSPKEIDLRAKPPQEVRDRDGQEPGFASVWHAVFAGGNLHVLDARIPSVTSFDRRGVLIGTVGRAGSGPGEYRFPVALAAVADTVAVWDPALRRVTWFPPRGGVRTTDLANGRGVQRLAGFGTGGQLIVQVGPFYGWPPDPDLEGKMRLALLDATGRVGRTLFQTPDSSSVAAPVPPPMQGSSVAAVPFAPKPRWVTTEAGLTFVATGSDFRILGIDAAGTVVTVVPIGGERAPVSETDRRSAEEKVGGYGPELAERVILRNVWPTVQGLVYGGGCLWVGRRHAAYPYAIRWEVIEPSAGRLVGAVVLDSAVSVLAADSRRIAVMWLDSLEVPHVGFHENPFRCGPFL